MNNKYGIHLANGPQDIERVANLGCDCYTVLHHQRDVLGRLRDRRPNALINVRHYDPDIMNRDPVKLAERNFWIEDPHPLSESGYMTKLYQAGVTDHYMPGNELNLAVEHSEAGWDQTFSHSQRAYELINEWLVAHIKRVREIAPWCKVHFPAFASGHSEDQPDYGFVGFDLCRKAVEMCDVLDHHDYWTGWGQLDREVMDSIWYAFRFERVHNLFPDMPIFISECSSTPYDPDQLLYYFDRLYFYDYVLGATPFIWDSPDPAHQAGRMVGRPVEVALKEANKRDMASNILEVRATIYDAIMKYARQFRVEPVLIAAVIKTESNFNPNAVGDLSIGGSYGLMQLYIKGAGAGHTIEELMDIDNNIRIGTQYLAGCLDAFDGNRWQGVSAYNQGIQGVKDRGWEFNSDYVGTVIRTHDQILAAGMRRIEETSPPEPIPEPAPEPVGEVPSNWQPYGNTWVEVAINLKGVADDALARMRRLRQAHRDLADNITQLGKIANTLADDIGGDL